RASCPARAATSSPGRPVRSTCDLQIRQRLLQLLDARVGHLRDADRECLQVLESLQVGQAVVGDLRAVQIQVPELRQALQVLQPFIRDLRQSQVQRAQVFHALQ